MKPADIYAATFLRQRADIGSVAHFLDGIDTYNDGLDQNRRVVVRTHFDPYIDGTRHASLYSVWLASEDIGVYIEGDEDHAWEKDRRLRDPEAAALLLQPVFVCKTGGRPDYEYYYHFITDAPKYGEMIGYLKSLEIVELPDNEDEEDSVVVSADQDIEELDRVYGYHVQPTDLGLIAHRRYSLLQRLRGWDNDRAWPYNHVGLKKPLTMKQRNQQRWDRIKDDVRELIKHDPACLPLRLMCVTRGGSLERIERMKTLITSLQPGW